MLIEPNRDELGLAEARELPAPAPEPAELRPADPPELVDALALRPATPAEGEDVDPWEELAAARAREEEALATIAHLRARVAALESWLEAAAAEQRVEHLQAQRLLLMKAAQRDRRWGFVLSLPILLGALYVAGVVVLLWALLLGRL